MERIVVRQLSEYLAASCLLPKFQSGFRRHHSTESALLRVLSDIFSATDRGEVSLLALLDVSAAFDTVDHSILLDRLSISYGISGAAFDWMQSFIIGRTQTVHYGGSVSRRAQLRSGIAQGSVLGPIVVREGGLKLTLKLLENCYYYIKKLPTLPHKIKSLKSLYIHK